MDIIFTKNDRSLFSRVIRSVTHEPVSHVALRTGPFVVHSNWKGINVTSFVKFQQQNKIIFSYPLEGSDSKLYNVLNLEGSGYDLPALLYLGCKLALAKVGIKLPKKNLWTLSGMYICTEFVSYVIYGKEDSMITPYKLYLRLTEK